MTHSDTRSSILSDHSFSLTLKFFPSSALHRGPPRIDTGDCRNTYQAVLHTFSASGSPMTPTAPQQDGVLFNLFQSIFGHVAQ